MYRIPVVLLLCASVALSAPQQNSNVTYVKQQLTLQRSQPETNPSERQTRLENIPLTVSGSVDKDKDPIENTSENSENIQTTDRPPSYNYSDRIYSNKTKPRKNNTRTEKDIPTTPYNEEVEEPGSKSDDFVSETDSDIVSAESILRDRAATNEETENFEIDATPGDEFVTEKYEEEATITTLAQQETTKAPTPSLLSKLSYFEKATTGSFSQNVIAISGKRRFRSRCRCEKIWNCAKLQISVPRCPEEYFLCCS